MPRKLSRSQAQVQPQTRQSPADKSREVEWGGFINVKLDVDQKQSFGEWLSGEGAGFWSALVDVVSEGIKYGLSYDIENQCFVATFTGAGVVGDARRYCLTARGATMESATALLVYKDQYLLGGDWGRFRPTTGGAEVE